ncbi:serine/threonine protein kinase [Streptomyces litchfieldiae]|uniref:Serine/threonine-protein kinase n=1 Tax=Streptomyces litchfieldiae TaxID=3075543 RepID=A0ABU2MKJ8_9ACTN|nr:serine/threonine-protein kinase [Streptomyces sp. DSM 44938]MDT0341967.1 serine/threonine-protein kinase [Streptomyces sp. DSM 44938]
MQDLGASDPRTLGRYRLRAELGRGSMGRVLLATGPHGELVAVKRVHDHLANDQEFRKRFRREVKASRKVVSRHTASVVDAGPDTDVPWLASEFVYGPSLREALDTVHSLPREAVLRLAAGLAAALRDIHAAGLVHRDLSPSNVLLADDGPRVIDFGIVRAVEGQGTTRRRGRGTTTDLTHTGMVLGAPAYMSPEQAEGRQLTPASDVFSLGTVLFVASAGTNPFEGPGIPQTMYNVVHTTPDFRGLPDPVRRVIEPCLAKDPGQRPSSADLLADIGTLPEAGRPWPAAVHRLTERQRAEVRRRVPGSDATTVRVEPTRTRTLPATGPGVPPPRPQPPRAPTPSSPGLSKAGPLIGVAVLAAALIVPRVIDEANSDDGVTTAPTTSFETDLPTGLDDGLDEDLTTPTDDEFTEPFPEDTFEEEPVEEEPVEEDTEPPSPTPDPIRDAVEGDCFDNYGTMDDLDLSPASCGGGSFEAVRVLHGTTDLSECDGVPDSSWAVSYGSYDLVMCLSYLHPNGSAYHTTPGECVYGPSDGGTVWDEVDCQTGNFTVVARYPGDSDLSDCDPSERWDHSRHYTVDTWPELNVRLCLSMNYPDDIGHAPIDTCLAMSGSGSDLHFTYADCSVADVYVTGRTSTYYDTGFCGSDGWSTWESPEFPELSYTACFRSL